MGEKESQEEEVLVGHEVLARLRGSCSPFEMLYSLS